MSFRRKSEIMEIFILAPIYSVIQFLMISITEFPKNKNIWANKIIYTILKL